MNALYPRMPRDAGISARTVVQFIVETDGSVNPRSVAVVSSTDPHFSAPSEKVLSAARFTPGRKDGHTVRTLVEMPLAWRAAPSPASVDAAPGPAGPVVSSFR
jgi:TonB family protein